MKDKVKVGVIGVGRGRTMIDYCEKADNAVLVAICDKWEEELLRTKNELNDTDIAFYTDYDEFLKHDMDVVILANYATEHAPFAIKAMNSGKDVISEVLPCQTMKEAVELVETVERTGKTYCYAENYCFMPAPFEMKKLYEEGKIGEIEYAEGEYIHNCETIWPSITYGEKEHWRNNMYSTFYCTHSIGPILHICGLRPISVTGFELPFGTREARMGAKFGHAGIEMITLENGAVIKSIHGGLNRGSIWYTVYGTKGRLESERESPKNGGVTKLYLEAYDEDGKYDKLEQKAYFPTDENSEKAKSWGHGGSDFYTMYNCMEKIRGAEQYDVIDVYQALDMFLPGMFAYRSVRSGGIPVQIPNLRNTDEREIWRNDTTCTDPKVAGDMLIPSYSKGNLEIDDKIYDGIRKVFLEEQARKEKR